MSFRFCVLTKLIFGTNDKNYDMYMFHVYWISIHMHHVSKCLNIMFLYLDEFLDKMHFLLKDPSFRKYGCWFLAKISMTQK